MKNFLKALLTGTLFLLPVAVFAVDPLNNAVDTFADLISGLIPVVFGLALLAFFWGLAMYLFSFGGEEKDKKKGRAIMLYGILVLFVALSVWGIAQLLQDTFGIDQIDSVEAPNVDF